MYQFVCEVFHLAIEYNHVSRKASWKINRDCLPPVPHLKGSLGESAVSHIFSSSLFLAMQANDQPARPSRPPAECMRTRFVSNQQHFCTVGLQVLGLWIPPPWAEVVLARSRKERLSAPVTRLACEKGSRRTRHVCIRPPLPSRLFPLPCIAAGAHPAALGHPNSDPP